MTYNTPYHFGACRPTSFCYRSCIVGEPNSSFYLLSVKVRHTRRPPFGNPVHVLKCETYSNLTYERERMEAEHKQTDSAPQMDRPLNETAHVVGGEESKKKSFSVSVDRGIMRLCGIFRHGKTPN